MILSNSDGQSWPGVGGFEPVETRTPFDEVAETEEREMGTFQEAGAEASVAGVTDLGRWGKELTGFLAFHFHDGFHPSCVYRRLLWSVRQVGLGAAIQGSIGVRYGDSRLKGGSHSAAYRNRDLFGKMWKDQQRLVERVFHRAALIQKPVAGEVHNMFANHDGIAGSTLPGLLTDSDVFRWRQFLAMVMRVDGGELKAFEAAERVVMPAGYVKLAPLQFLGRLYALAWFLVPIREKFLASLPECDVAILLAESKAWFSKRIHTMFSDPYGLKAAGMKSLDAQENLRAAAMGNKSKERRGAGW